MSNVDNRIVRMEFDNASFQEKVDQTINTLQNLKDRLKFDESNKTFQELQRAANSIDMQQLAANVDYVAQRFTVWGQIGSSILTNLGNDIYAFGKKMVDTVAVDPLKDGWGEYELKMGSIQTIMAGTGESLETVNKYLEELNKYSDKTIYSFSDMTNSIGKFTNNGVKLEDAVAAIKGVANEAARSGATASDASRAMYNFAQALSSGYVKLIDWKSIENANMATKEFKQELINTAVEVGTLKKVSKDMYEVVGGDEAGTKLSALKDFNDSLKGAWMTTDVLTKTLGRYADESTKIGREATNAATEVKTFTMMTDALKEALGSGWAMTWENIFGNFNEGKKLWTDINNVLSGLIDKFSALRNDPLENWHDNGGRAAVFQGLTNIFEKLGTIMGKISETWREVFGVIDKSEKGSKLIALSKQFEKFTSKLELSTTALDNVHDIFKAVFTGIKIVLKATSTIVSTAVKAFWFLFKMISKVFGVVVNITASFSRFVLRIIDAVSWIKTFIDRLSAMSKRLKDTISETLHLQETVQKIKDAFANLKQTLFEVFHIDDILNRIESMGEKIKAFFESANFEEGVVARVKQFADAIAGFVNVDGILTRTTNAITGFAKGLASMIPGGAIIDFFTRLGTNIKEFFDAANAKASIKKGTLGFISSLSNYTSKLVDQYWFANNIMPSVNSMIAMTRQVMSDLLNTLKQNKIIQKFTTFFKELGNQLKELLGITPDVKESLSELGDAISSKFNKNQMDAFSAFGESVGKIGDRVKNKANESKSALQRLINTITEFVKSIDKNQVKQLLSGAFTAILSLVYLDSIRRIGSTFKTLSDAFGTLVESVGEVIGSIGSLAEATAGLIKTMKKVALAKIAATILVSFAASMVLIASAIYIISKVDPKNMDAAINAILKIAACVAGVLLASAIFTAVVKSQYKQLAAMGIVMIGLGVAMMMLASATATIADVAEKGHLAKSVFALSYVMGQLIGAILILMGMVAIFRHYVNVGDILTLGFAMVSMSGAIVALVGAVDMIYGLMGNGMKKPLAAVGAITVLILALAAYTKAIGGGKTGKFLAASLSTVILTTSILIMAAAINRLAQLDMDNVIKAGEIILGFGVLLALINAFVRGAQGLKNLGRMVLAVGVGMALLATAFMMFNAVSWSAIGKGLLVLGTLMIALGGILFLAKAPGDMKSLVQVAASIMMISASMVMLAGAFMLLAMVPSDKLWSIGGALAILVIAIGGMLAIMAPLGTGLLVAAAAFGVFGLSIILLGVGMAAFALSLTVVITLINSLGNMGDSLSAGLDKLKDIAKTVGEALMKLGDGLITAGIGAIVGGVGLLVFAAGLLAIGFAGSVASGGIIDLTLAGLALLEMLSAIPGLGDKITADFDGIRSGITETLGVKAGWDAGKAFTESYVESTAEGSGEVKEATTALLQTGVTDTINESAPEVKGAADNTTGMFRCAVIDAIPGTKDGVKELLGGMTDTMEDGSGAFANAADVNIDSYSSEALSELSGVDLSKGSKKAAKTLDNGADYKQKGTNSAKQWGEGFTSGGQYTVAAINKVMAKTKSAATDDWKPTGGDASKGYANGIAAFASLAAEKARALVAGAKQAAKDEQDSNSPSKEFEKLGKWAGQGYYIGMEGTLKKIAEKAAKMAKKAKDSTKKEQDSNSPSKVFESLGRSAGEQYADGIVKSYSRIEDRSSGMVSIVGNAIKMIANAMDSDLDSTPTITPVLDLSNIEKGSSLIGSMLSGSSISTNVIAGSISTKSNSQLTFEMMNSTADMLKDAVIDGVNQAITAQTELDSNRTYTFISPTVLNGREIARSSATYTQAELDKLQTRANRQLGIV